LIVTLLLFAFSLAVLIYSSNRFISSAETIGYSLGVSPFVIGVTVVAFGTSLPELTTSILAVSGGASDIVVGNVIGSNITNILLVIGISAMAAGTLIIERDIMDEDMAMLFGSSALLFFACRDFYFSMPEAIIFLSGLSGFLLYGLRATRDEGHSSRPKPGLIVYIILILGALGVYIGAQYTVEYLEKIAETLSVPSSFVSLTLLALGTSLPEVVVSVMAVRKGQHSIALGNVIGSNIFNAYAVMAIPSFFGEVIIPKSIMEFGMPFLLMVTVLFGIICVSKRISFWKAGMLISFYIFFIVELIRMGFVN
jgi:cation:H+ antiporter